MGIVPVRTTTFKTCLRSRTLTRCSSRLSQMRFAVNAPFKVMTSPGEGNGLREACTGHLLGARLGCLRCASRNTSWPASRAVGVTCSGSTFIGREKRSRRRSLRRAAATPPFCYSGSHAWGPEVQVVRVVLNSSSSTKSWLLCARVLLGGAKAWGCNALESQGCE